MKLKKGMWPGNGKNDYSGMERFTKMSHNNNNSTKNLSLNLYRYYDGYV